MTFEVEVSLTAKDALAAITDKRIQRNIFSRLQRLEKSPEKQGKPLTGDLKGYYSIRVADQRYRIIYRIQTEPQIVFVEFIGIRREGSKSDGYVLFSHLREDT